MTCQSKKIIITVLLLNPAIAVSITACSNITSPGEYYLTADLSGLQTGQNYCIGILSDNVTLYGSGYTLTGGTSGSGVWCNGADNITIRDSRITGYYYGLYSQSCTNVNILNNTVSGPGYYAVYGTTSSGNIINNTLISGPSTAALVQPSDLRVYSNYLDLKSSAGIGIYVTAWNTVQGNTIVNVGTGTGLQIVGSYCTVRDNIVRGSGSSEGIYLGSYNNCKIIGNRVHGTAVGIELYSSYSNTIYNNLFNATTHVLFSGTLNSNTWDTGTPQAGEPVCGLGNQIGGNCYINSTGGGYSNTCVDADLNGICDSPFSLETGNVDNLPLSAFIGNKLDVTGVGTMFNFTVNGTLANESYFIGVHNVTVHDLRTGKLLMVIPVNFTAGPSASGLNGTSNVTSDGRGYAYVQVPAGIVQSGAKTLYVPAARNTGSLCVIDGAVQETVLTSVTRDNCTSAGGVLLDLNASQGYYVLSGLTHSGAVEVSPVRVTVSFVSAPEVDLVIVLVLFACACLACAVKKTWRR